MIINIRGTNGSGKSTVVFNLMEKYGYGFQYSRSNKKKAEATLIDAPYGFIYAIGQYKTQCGGCDGVKTQDEVCRLVKKYSKKGHVIFEGVIVATCYRRYRDLLRKSGDYRMCFIDTPLRTCISNIKKRRLKKGNTKLFNPEGATNKFHQIRRDLERAKNDVMNYRVLNYKQATEQVEWLLRSK